MPKELVHGQAPDGAPAGPVVHVGWQRGTEYVEVATIAPDGQDLEQARLDRDGINRLIRCLRKARDAAYGSDA